VHRAEREQPVIHAVVGEDGDGLVRPEAALEQRLADAPRGFQRLRVGDLAPLLAVAFGEKHAPGCVFRPAQQPLPDAALVAAQRLRRAQYCRAVGAPLDPDIGRREAQSGVQHHGFLLRFSIVL